MKRWGFISTYIIIVPSILLVASYGVQAYTDNWVDGTPFLHEEGRRLAEILGHEDEALLAPAIAAKAAAPAYDIGDEKIFYAFNMSTNRQYTISASLRLVSDMAYIFVENGRSVANSKIDSLSSSFGNIYDKISGQFGPPPDSIDGDPRIYLLIMDIADGEPVDGSRIIGYFSPIDQYRNVQLVPFTNYRSNEVEMLYIDYISLDLPSGGQSVIAHEFAHVFLKHDQFVSSKDPYKDEREADKQAEKWGFKTEFNTFKKEQEKMKNQFSGIK